MRLRAAALRKKTRSRIPIALVLAVAALVPLAAGCGGGGSAGVASVASTTTGSSGSSTGSPAASAQGRGAIAYARCMRGHGVQDFPDPDGNGGFPAGAKQIALSNPRYQAAQSACRHLLPTRSGPTAAQVQQAMNAMANLARCIRSHGVPNWPDPYLDVGRPTFDIHGIDYKAPRISAAIHDCRHLMPGSTLPRMCSSLLAEQTGSPPGDEACFGGSATVP